MRRNREEQRAADRAKAKQMYEAGFEISDIARELRVTNQWVRILLKKEGVKLRTSRWSQTRLTPKPEELPTVRQKILAAASESKTWTQVANKLGWSGMKLYYWRKTFDIGNDALNQDITKEILEAAIRAGKSPMQISRELGTSRGRIVRLAQKWGLPIQRERQREWLAGRNRQEIGAKIREMALDGVPMKTIAATLQVPYIVVYYELKKAGIHQARMRNT